MGFSSTNNDIAARGGMITALLFITFLIVLKVVTGSPFMRVNSHSDVVFFMPLAWAVVGAWYFGLAFLSACMGAGLSVLATRSMKGFLIALAGCMAIGLGAAQLMPVGLDLASKADWAPMLWNGLLWGLPPLASVLDAVRSP